MALTASSLAHGLMLGEDVHIGEDVSFGAYVVVHDGTSVGDGSTIEDHVVLGKRPRLAGSSSGHGAVGPLRLGERVTVCAGAVVFAGALVGEGTILGDQSFVRERSVIGAGSVIGRGSVVDNDVQVGARVRVQTNVYLCAFTVVEDDVFVGPGVITTNDDTMGRHGAADAAAGRDPAARLPHRRRRGADPGRRDRRGGVRDRRRGRHRRRSPARGGDGGARPGRARGSARGPARALALGARSKDAAAVRGGRHDLLGLLALSTGLIGIARCVRAA